MDLRERVLADLDGGLKTRAVATKYTVSGSWVRRLKQRRAATGGTAARPPRNRRVGFRDRHAEALRAAVAADPNRTLAELRDHLGVRVGLDTLWLALTALKIAWKKVGPGGRAGAAGRGRPADPVAGVAGRVGPGRPRVPGRTWATTNMARRYGWGPTAERVVGRVPHGHWETTTFVAVLRADGLTAPMVIVGAMTGDLFAAYARQILAPALRPGDVVVMDNLQCHKRAEAIRAIERVAFLPPYSPDPNPIELAFSKLKATPRRREERTVEGLWAALGQSLDWFPPDGCRRYLRHAGYTLQRA